MQKSYSVVGKSVENYTVGSHNKVIDYINVFIPEKSLFWTKFGLQINQLIISNFSFLQRTVWHGFLIHRSNVLHFLPMQINPLNRCLFLSTSISRNWHILFKYNWNFLSNFDQSANTRCAGSEGKSVIPIKEDKFFCIINLGPGETVWSGRQWLNCNWNWF
jgi:hypothetical protein